MATGGSMQSVRGMEQTVTKKAGRCDFSRFFSFATLFTDCVMLRLTEDQIR
jgi:hypothetical protein